MEGTMQKEAELIAILSADRVREGLVVTFSDGTTTLFQAAFLYSVRGRQESLNVEQQDVDDGVC